MKRTTALLTATSLVAFAGKGATAAAPDAAKTEMTTDATVATATTDTPKAARVVPELTAVRTDIPLPQGASRGSKSTYDFDSIAGTVGASFGVKNKDARSLGSVVTNANKRFAKEAPNKTNPDGSIVYKTTEMRDGAGNVTHMPTTEPEKEQAVVFKAFDVDAKTDPDGAQARIFRVK